MIIMPEVLVTPDRPTVRFREPKGQVDLEKELQRVLFAQGWSLGMYFNVQFISHDRTKLLSQAAFVVTEDEEEFKTNNDNPHSPASRTTHTRKAVLVGQWQNFGELPDLEDEEAGMDLQNKLLILEDRIIALENRPRPGRKPKAAVS